jgi:hypothetical protein
MYFIQSFSCIDLREKSGFFLKIVNEFFPDLIQKRRKLLFTATCELCDKKNVKIFYFVEKGGIHVNKPVF